MRALILVALFVLLLAPAVHAITIYSNFGPGYTYNINAAYPVTGIAAPDYDKFDIALDFIPTGTYGLDSITVAMCIGNQSVSVNEVALSICSDAGGQPGAVLESWTIPVPIEYGFGFIYNPPLSANSVLNPLLTSGTRYWLLAEAATDESVLEWNLSSPTDVGSLSFRMNGGAWTTYETERSAFQVNGSDIPEPTTLALLGCGILVLLFFSRRRAIRGSTN